MFFHLADLCTENEHQCESGDCIPLSQKCDKFADCPNGDDELDCPAEICDPNREFSCEFGEPKCIPIQNKCDTRYDCEDGSDELNCGCKANEFSCSDGKQCIDAR